MSSLSAMSKHFQGPRHTHSGRPRPQHHNRTTHQTHPGVSFQHRSPARPRFLTRPASLPGGRHSPARRPPRAKRAKLTPRATPATPHPTIQVILSRPRPLLGRRTTLLESSSLCPTAASLSLKPRANTGARLSLGIHLAPRVSGRRRRLSLGRVDVAAPIKSSPCLRRIKALAAAARPRPTSPYLLLAPSTRGLVVLPCLLNARRRPFGRRDLVVDAATASLNAVRPSATRYRLLTTGCTADDLKRALCRLVRGAAGPGEPEQRPPRDVARWSSPPTPLPADAARGSEAPLDAAVALLGH